MKNNSELIEKLVIGMKESKTNAIVLSGIDEYIKQNNQFVIDNEKALRDFYYLHQNISSISGYTSRKSRFVKIVRFD